MHNNISLSKSPSQINKTNPIMNETWNSFLLPRKTSTPKNSPIATPIRPRRYSLSEINGTQLFLNRNKSRFDVQRSNSNNASPINATPKYNVDLSTYMDTKSPGYAGRVVQYEQEQQSRYNGIGNFPIVHLFKKDLPILKRKPSKVMVRIAPPDFSKLNSPEHNRMLLEKIVQSNNIPPTPNNCSDISTRSVLDALKEISRKRIHANEEEYESTIDNSGKRIRLENASEMEESKKRQREDTSWENCILAGSTPKRICSLNELTASQTSMKPNLQNIPKSRKKIIDVTEIASTEKVIEIKPATQVVDVETQTTTPHVMNKATDPKPQSESEDMIIEEKDNKIKNERNKFLEPLIVFDDEPLEYIRKRRLFTLMDSFSNEKAQGDHSNRAETRKSPDKTLISILSAPNNKNLHKTTKHVTFNLPPSSMNVSNSSLLTQTCASITTPLVSSNISECRTSIPINIQAEVKESPGAMPKSLETTEVKKLEEIVKKSETVQFPSLVKSTDSITNEKLAAPMFQLSPKKVETSAIPISFGLAPNNPESTNITSTQSNYVLSNSSTSNFSFGKTPTSNAIELPKSLTASVPTTSPKKIGGFKFDLNKPVSVAPTISTPPFSFGGSPPKPVEAITNANTQFSFGSLPKSEAVPISSNVPIPAFGVLKKSEATTSIPFGASSMQKSEASKPVSNALPLGFGSIKSDAASPTVFGSTPKSETPNQISFSNSNPKNASTNQMSFGSSQKSDAIPISFGSAPKTESSSFGSSQSKRFFAQQNTTPSFSFNAISRGGSTSTTNSSNVSNTFNTIPSLNTSTGFDNAAKPSFGVSTKSSFAPSNVGTTSTGVFGMSTTSFTNTNSTPVIFSTPVTSSFQNPSTQAGSMFSFGGGTNNAMTTTVGSAAINLGFNSTSVTTAAFGGSNIKSPFVTPSTSSMFGSGNTPMFGTVVTSGSTFGTNSTPSFGRPTTTPTFSTSNFGVPNTTLSFGSSNPVFGSTTNATVTTSSVATTSFNNASSSMFGSSNQQGFNTATTKPLFGATSNSGAPFGSSNAVTTASVFGGSNVFGSTNNSFGATDNKFGVVTTSASAFGGNTAVTPGFGSNSFGANTPSGFESAAASTSFGANNATFGTPTTTSGGFGNNTNNFGANPAFPSSSPFGGNTAQAVPAFGSATVTPQSNVFGSSFGSNSVTAAGSTFPKLQSPQNSFAPSNPYRAVFGGGTNAQSNSFINSNTNNNAGNSGSGVFTFGSSNTKPSGIFSFGSSEPPKPSFNFSGGSSLGSAPVAAFGANASGFGQNSEPIFGAGAPPPAFNAQPNGPGVFSIGSGSTTSRARTQLKAKRRT